MIFKEIDAVVFLLFAFAKRCFLFTMQRNRTETFHLVHKNQQNHLVSSHKTIF